MTPRITISASVWRAVGISLCAVLFAAAVLVDVLGTKTNTNPGLFANASVSPAPKVGAALDPPASPSATKQAAPQTTPRASPDATDGTARPGGPGVTEAGIDLRLSPRTDGSFDVVEHLIIRTPAASVVLVTPDRKPAGKAFAHATPRVSGLQADSGGQPIYDLPSGEVRGKATLHLGGTTTSLNLRYRLAGTSVVSIPSSAGRSLAFIRPITAGIDPNLPVQVHADGAGVLNLTCPELSGAQQGCARGAIPALFVTGLSCAKSTIIVQFNLPEP